MADSPSTLSTAFARRYTIERELGRGATSIVHLARDLAQSRTVAIKMLRSELADSVAEEHFRREIRRTAQLQNPHIVPVLDSGEVNGMFYYVLPFMEGGTLRDRLKRDKQLPLAEVIAIGRTLASALESAHAKGLIHRDVKPENILFTAGQACLADFGIARALAPASGESTTSTGVVRGTPAYMSPEQASGDRDYDGRSDIYSLACVLYEAIAGVAAFVGPTSQSVVAQRLVHMPRPLRVYRPTVPPELEQALERALTLAAADRYQTAGEFAAALGALEPLLARPGGTAAPPVKSAHPWLLAGRRRWIVGGVIGTVAIAFAGVWARTAGRPLDRCAPDQPVDASRIALFHFADPPGRPSSVTGQLVTRMLRAAAARRWSNVPLVTEDDVPSAAAAGADPSIRELACTAQRHRAARLVTGSLTPVRDSVLVRAMVYGSRGDVATGLERQLMIAASDAPSPHMFDPLVIALLRPEQEPKAAWYADTLTSDYATWQEFARARALIDSGAIDSAHAALLVIHNREPAFAPSIVWLAQTEAWLAPRRSAEWSLLARRAMENEAKLSARDGQLAHALVAMGESRFDEACRGYARLIAADSADFVAWFGAGECRGWDSLVVRDARSPSGWAFHTQSADAVARYARAAELCPGEFMRTVLAALTLAADVVPRVRPGWDSSGTNRATFAALAGYEHGRMGHVPIPMANLAMSAEGSVPVTLGDALDEARRLLLRISETWVRRFPRSADAHAARGRALELQGILLPGPRTTLSADDELATAMALSSVPVRRFELGVDRLRVHVKAGDYAGANRMADGLLRHPPAGDARDSLLSGVAALVGRSAQASEYGESVFRRDIAEQAVHDAVPAEALADAARVRVLAALGVCGDTLTRLENRMAAVLSSSLRDKDAAVFREDFLTRGLSLSASCDAFRPALRAPTTGDALVRVQQAMASSRHDRALALLDTLARQRRAVPRSEISLDYVVQESLVRAATGDTARAIADLAASLDALHRSGTFRIVRVDEPAAVGRALVLLARLTQRRDLVAFAHWRDQVRQLWKGADAIVLETQHF